NLVAVLLSEKRDKAAVESFFCSARTVTGRVPERVTNDGHDAYPGAIKAQLGEEVHHRTNRYLNNPLEEDQRRVKQRVSPMLVFQRFDSAAVTRAGIELIHQIEKQQFPLSTRCPAHTRTPHVWQAVLAA